jgi:Ca2+/H+ antiporter
MTDQQNVDVDRAARHEELRFAKKQQLYVATSAVTLLAAIFAIARSTTLSDVEKAIATVFIVLIATYGIVFLFKLQDHLKAVRKELVKERIPSRGGAAWTFFSC